MSSNGLKVLQLVAFAATISLVARAIVATARPSHGFVTYYTASRLLLEGASPERFYDDDWFASQVDRFEPGIYDIYGANFPTMAFVAIPLARLPYRAARWTWLGINLLLVGGFLLWARRTLRLDRVQLLALVVLVGVFHPLHRNLFHGQAYVAVLGVLSVALMGWISNGLALGLSLGALFVSKTTGLVMWLLPATAGRWRAIGWGLGLVVGVGVLSVPVVGADSWERYFEVAAALPAQGHFSVTAYQDVPGLLQHLLVFNATWNPNPVVHAPVLAASLSIGIALVLIAFTSVVSRKEEEPALAFGAFVVLSVILAPVSLDYHYTVMLLPLAIALQRIQEGWRSSAGLLWLTSAVLMAADLPYRSDRLTAGHGDPGVPQAHGAVFLWGLLMWTMSRSGRDAPGSREPTAQPEVVA